MVKIWPGYPYFVKIRDSLKILYRELITSFVWRRTTISLVARQPLSCSTACYGKTVVPLRPYSDLMFFSRRIAPAMPAGNSSSKETWME